MSSVMDSHGGSAARNAAASALQASRLRMHAKRKRVNTVALALSLAAMAFGVFWLIWILVETVRLGIGGDCARRRGGCLRGHRACPASAFGAASRPHPLVPPGTHRLP